MNDSETPAITDPLATNNVVALPPRNEEPAHKRVARFVQDHPVATVAGGLAIGALAAAFIPRRNRRYIAEKSSVWAEAVAAASAALAQQAMAKADAASDSVRHGASAFADRAEGLGHAAIGRAERLGGKASGTAHRLMARVHPEPTFGEKVAAQAGRLKGRMGR